MMNSFIHKCLIISIIGFIRHFLQLMERPTSFMHEKPYALASKNKPFSHNTCLSFKQHEMFSIRLFFIYLIKMFCLLKGHKQTNCVSTVFRRKSLTFLLHQ